MHAEVIERLGYDHGAVPPPGYREQRTRWVVGLTAGMMGIELVAGHLTGSLALTADGWHMATHAGALGLSATAYWFARSRAEQETFSFGTGKVYALAGYTSAVALALVALWMVGQAAQRLLRPPVIHFAEALPVAMVGLLVNVVCLVLLAADEEHGDPTTRGGFTRDDHNWRAAYLHVLADALTSVLAIVALLAGRYWGWVFVDASMGFVGGALILQWSAALCRDAARQLLDVVPSPAGVAALRRQLESIDDVRVADLHLWEMGPGRHGCIVSLVSALPRETGFYRDAILTHFPLAHLTVEVHRCMQGH